MRKGFLGAVGVWMSGATLALAQAPSFQPAQGFHYPSAPLAYHPSMAGYSPGVPPGYPGVQAPAYSPSYYQSPAYPGVQAPAYSPSYYQSPAYPGMQAPVHSPSYYQPPVLPTPPPASYPYPARGYAGMPAQQGAQAPPWTPRPVFQPASQSAPIPYSVNGPLVVPHALPPMPPAEEAPRSEPAAPAMPPTAPAAERAYPLPMPEPIPPASAGPAPALRSGETYEVAAPAPEPLSDLPRKVPTTIAKTPPQPADSGVSSTVVSSETVYGRPWGLGCGLGWGLGWEGFKDRLRMACLDFAAFCSDSAFCCGGFDEYPLAFWFALDYLHWQAKSDVLSVPIVAVSGGTVLGESDIEYNDQTGFRIRTGLRICEKVTWENNFFWLDEENLVTQASSVTPDSLPLVRPLVDQSTGTIPLNIPVSSPGLFGGTVRVDASTKIGGVESNLACALCCSDWAYFDFLMGLRYLNLEESVEIVQVSQSLADQSLVIGAGDLFDTKNRFFGGQVGFATGMQCGRFYLGGSSKVAVGVNWSELTQGGAVTTNGLVLPIAGTGILATRNGVFKGNDVSVVPEFAVETGCRVTKCINLMVGYNFLYWSRVARPGEQITNVISPSVQENEPRETSFWIHGLTATMGFRF